MKYLIIILLVNFLSAKNYELSLYETLFTSLFHKNKINIYTTNKKLFYKSKVFRLTNCANADIVLINKLPNICKNKPFFVTSYLDYIHSNAIGAFYWRKSRPQIVLNKKMIKYYHLYLDKSLKKYAK